MREVIRAPHQSTYIHTRNALAARRWSSRRTARLARRAKYAQSCTLVHAAR